MLMIKKMAVAAIIVGLASLVVGAVEKVTGLNNIAGFSPAGFGQGAVIFFLLSINLLILDKKT